MEYTYRIVDARTKAVQTVRVWGESSEEAADVALFHAEYYLGRSSPGEYWVDVSRRVVWVS